MVAHNTWRLGARRCDESYNLKREKRILESNNSIIILGGSLWVYLDNNERWEFTHKELEYLIPLINILPEKKLYSINGSYKIDLINNPTKTREITRIDLPKVSETDFAYDEIFQKIQGYVAINAILKYEENGELKSLRGLHKRNLGDLGIAVVSNFKKDSYEKHINDTLIADANAPGGLTWDSEATSDHSDNEAVEFQDFNVTSFAYLSPYPFGISYGTFLHVPQYQQCDFHP